jgi:hypothetical protein
MAIINTNGSFGTSDTVNSTNLNAVADGATFNDPVDEETLELITTGGDTGKLRVKAGGVDTTQIASNAVNFSKLTDVNDDNTMSNASATTLATSESIKAYVDSAPNFIPSTFSGEESVTLPNGLIMKFGTGTTVNETSGQGTSTIDLSVHSSDFPNGCLNASATLINPDGGLNSNRDGWMQVRSVSTSELKFVTQGTSSLTTPSTYFWQAIGY